MFRSLLGVLGAVCLALSASLSNGSAYAQQSAGLPPHLQLHGVIDAWQKVRGTAQIGVIDHGLQVGHEAFSQNVRYQSARLRFDDPLQVRAGAAQIAVDESNIFFPYGRETCLLSVSPPGCAGHGTHVTGLLVANPNDVVGYSGVCQHCSLTPYAAGDGVSSWRALNELAGTGVQVVSMSFGDPPGVSPYQGLGWGGPPGLRSQIERTLPVCNLNPTVTGFINAGLPLPNNFSNDLAALYCQNLQSAKLTLDSAHAQFQLRDVVVVAASGNDQAAMAHFPYSSPSYPGYLIAGGINPDGTFWNGSSGFGANYPTHISASASVVSTFYKGTHWNSTCLDLSGTGGPGFGPCTGTSMAAPIVAGVVGLIRSANPLLKATEVKSILLSTATPCVGSDAPKCGVGHPNAAAAVNEALAPEVGPALRPLVINRLTPLFSLNSRGGFVHTVVPQVAAASINGYLPSPTPNSYNGGGYPVGAPYGDTVPGYLGFPAFPVSEIPYAQSPRAAAMVFTAHGNPYGGTELMPIQRFVWDCQQAKNSYWQFAACSADSGHVARAYATTAGDVAALVGQGYILEGLEGYVFPPNGSLPAGTVKICRKYNSEKGQFVLFAGVGSAGTSCPAIVSPDGIFFSENFAGVDTIGYGYGVREVDAVFPMPSTIVPASLSALPSSHQIAQINTAFGRPIRVKVVDVSGRPAPGVVVTFSAPASGASAALASTSVTTDITGVATALATANSSIGSYQITASIAQGAQSAVNLTNSLDPSLPTQFINGSFENPLLDAGAMQGSFEGTAWYGPSYMYSYGVSSNGSPHTQYAGAAPHGTQVAFLAGNGAISQTLVLYPGRYKVQMKVASGVDWPGTPYGNAAVEVRRNNSVILSYTLPTGFYSYVAVETQEFDVEAAGSFSFVFRSAASPWLLLDDIKIVPVTP